jgi:1-deoxy-D-xylulose-5-phosphate reductoisomerase
MRKRRIILLGATGSIGASTVKVAQEIPERMEIVAMAANSNAEKLAESANLLRPETLCLVDERKLPELRDRLAYRPTIVAGERGLVEVCRASTADLALIAIVGTAGLRPAIAAIETGKDLAVASKEILVMAGEIMMQQAATHHVQILPVDSEHNAIFQCLEGRAPGHVKRLILTASGGPFRTWSPDRLREVCLADALKHPTWQMGQKITIDSATLFNKGLEMIEARWLFNVGMNQIEVVIHPQSIVHSMVEFVDGSILAQLSHSDMCFPIQYAVTWPERVPNRLRSLNLAELSRLDFEEPRYETFPALQLARRAGESGGLLPAVLNAANETAVEAFVSGRIPFPGIWEVVRSVMERICNLASPSLDDILRADGEARVQARTEISKY